MTDVQGPTIYTIGHSTHTTERLIGLLAQHKIETVVDVRSSPYSRRNPQFNQPALRESLWIAGIQYGHLGDLGGYPDDKASYDEGGHALYERIVATKSFKDAMKHLNSMVDDARLAVMCAQGKPEDCHRHPLLARCLQEFGVTVLHILRDGDLRDAADMFDADIDEQLPLFELPGEDPYWRSPLRVR